MVDRKIRIVVCGDGYAGKTSLIHRLVLDRFDQNNQVSCFDEYCKDFVHDDVKYSLEFLDLGG